MAVDVIMPQMGESIAEGTLVKWLKNVGDKVERDEPLFEISTDKVDAEIPSPAAGTLLEVLVQPGTTVDIKTVVGRIGAQGESARDSAPKAAAVSSAPAPATATAPAPAPKPNPVPAATSAAAPAAVAERTFVRSSPVVQKIAAEHGVDVSLIEGTGEGGRITKKDIMTYIESAASSAAPIAQAAPAPTYSAPVAPAPSAAPAAAPAAPKPAVFAAGQDEVREPMSIMRKKIAEHMVMSKHTSPHVYTIFEVDMNEVVKRREAAKKEFEGEGVKLTFLPYFIEAAIRGIKEYPIINSSVDGDTIIYKKTVNVGIAVAIQNGLIVPVIKKADQMNLLGLAKTAADLGERARTKRLVPDDVQGGTFTITNVGVFGGTFGLPIINQPQAAIMGLGTITKRPVVIDDAIAIRPIVYLSLSYDHRIVDGADAARFLTVVKRELEKPAA
ncbi:MAG TPA: 2-oxoglutarate dehydrogenase, E2 component, dihydrolipoamide succinyltransferase [Candidatus Krumholzibacteria bacterium]|nr:2-oxoglutarate dehydrogenase, E2 component, dihydrolipoamide succinyltransferase [Candidatus Krumholzibacteria bacterium]